MLASRNAVFGLIVIVAGCAAPDETDSTRKASIQSSADPVAESHLPLRPDRLREIFRVMDSPGEAARSEFRSQVADLSADPSALTQLVDAYSRLPARAFTDRYKVVAIIAQLGRSGSIEFLETVALGPPEVDPAATGQEAGDLAFRIRHIAAVSVVRAASSKLDGAQVSVQKLLKVAEPSIAQLVGVELFSAGKLDSTLKSLLTERRIYADFKRIEGEELRELRNLHSDTDHSGARRSRPLPDSVPVIEGSHAR